MGIETTHAAALAWTGQLEVPHALVWEQRAEGTEDARTDDNGLERAARRAVHTLFAPEGLPAAYAPNEAVGGDLLLLRDPLGKPYLHWRGQIADWARACGREDRHLHITNSHDGDTHLILVAYHERLAGIGIDLVHLPRLRAPGKGADYLRRLAAHFMSQPEREAFDQARGGDDEEALRLRVAAHFSLMEAASKALGTGLKIGGGMGRPESLPKQSLGVRSLTPKVEFLLAAEARQRMTQLGASRCDGYWSADADYLVSAAMLYRD